MTIDLSAAVTVASALALLTALASSYGWLKRSGLPVWAAQVLLGTLFGLVAMLQMRLPVEPIEGIVIDLRAIPVALAGAFLGWRGALACAAIAAATRLGIGGIGAPSGVAVVVLTALIGLAWARLTRDGATRGVRALLGLGAMTCANMGSLVLLPPAIAWWFAGHVTPVLCAAYVVLVPLLALLMQREDASIWIERQLRASAATDPATGLLTMDALGRAAARSADAPGRGTGLALFRIRHALWIEQVHGARALDTVRAALRARLEEGLAGAGVLARTPGGAVAALLLDRDGVDAADLAARLARDLSSRPVRMADGGELRVSLDLGTTWTAAPRPLSELLEDAARALERNGAAGGVDVTEGRRGLRTGLREALFEKPARLRG